VRRETGKEQVVKVHCDEGVAIHIGLKPCIAFRKEGDEASVEDRAGQAIEPRKFLIPGADGVPLPEGNTRGRANASTRSSRRGRRTWHARTLPAREPGDLLGRAVAYRTGPHREGEEP
jgi:hypothetical protein